MVDWVAYGNLEDCSAAPSSSTDTLHVTYSLGQASHVDAEESGASTHCCIRDNNAPTSCQLPVPMRSRGHSKLDCKKAHVMADDNRCLQGADYKAKGPSTHTRSSWLRIVGQRYPYRAMYAVMLFQPLNTQTRAILPCVRCPRLRHELALQLTLY